MRRFRLIWTLLLAACLCAPAAAATAPHVDSMRIKDLGKMSGWRDNALTGYGLVTGLAGTGDSARNKATRQSIANMLARFDLTIAAEDVQSRNVAAVMVTAVLSPFARAGDTVDVTVTSIGDARSLVGGALMLAPLKGPDGKISGGGHLSFDQYEQDQVIQLTQSEYNGRRWAAMIVNDRPDTALDFDMAERLSKMPDGPEKTAALQKVQADGTFGRQRLYVGKTRDRESAVMLNDAMGRPRILMKVTSDGKASIDFLDDKGGVIRSVTPDAK